MSFLVNEKPETLRLIGGFRTLSSTVAHPCNVLLQTVDWNSVRKSLGIRNTPKSISAGIMWVGLILGLLAGCGNGIIGGGDGGNNVPPTPRDLTFCQNLSAGGPTCSIVDFDVREKLAGCAGGVGGGCHAGTAPQLGLEIDLSNPVDMPEAVLNDYLNEPATVCSTDLLIDTENPDCSFMLTKVTGKPFCGQRMPVTVSEHFTDQEVDCFRKWLNDTYGGL